MNYWLHRISHWGPLSYPLLEERGLLSIGWSDFSEEDYLDQCIGNWEKFEERFNEEWGHIPRNRHNLWRFISEMEKGDYVLVPRWWGEFAIYKIVDDRPFSIEKLDLVGLKDWEGNEIKLDDEGYLCRRNEDSEEEQIDLGFFRKVEPVIKKASRSDYADQALTSRMKVRVTNADINDLESNIEKAIKAFEEGKPINLQSIILDDSIERVLKMIHEELDDRKFEYLIEWYFEKAGASKVEIPSRKAEKEGDADIIATFEEIRTIIYVQAKKHVGETSSWALEQIDKYKDSKDAVDDDYSGAGWVISSADDFSDDCKEAAIKNGIILIDGREFAEMILKIGISGMPGSESAS